MKKVLIYTDGACSGNPGPGGWGAILKYGEVEKELSGGEELTTNNRMELTAAIKALSALKEPCIVDLYSDSKYLIGSKDAYELNGKGEAIVNAPNKRYKVQSPCIAFEKTIELIRENNTDDLPYLTRSLQKGN